MPLFYLFRAELRGIIDKKIKNKGQGISHLSPKSISVDLHISQIKSAAIKRDEKVS